MFSLASHFNLLRQDLSQTLELTPQIGLWSVSLSDDSACAHPSAGVTGTGDNAQLFLWVLGIQAKALMLVQRVLSPT